MKKTSVKCIIRVGERCFGHYSNYGVSFGKNQNRSRLLAKNEKGALGNIYVCVHVCAHMRVHTRMLIACFSW